MAALSETVADLSRQIAQAVIASVKSGKDSSDEFNAKLNYVLGQLDLRHSKKLRVLADPAL